MRGLSAGKTVAPVVHPADDGERVFEAIIVRTDALSDLALLRATGPKGESPKELTPLELGTTADLTETQSVTTFGYPFGERRGGRDRKYPSISVNVMLMPCLASADGGPVFTGEGNVYTADMQPIPAPELKGATLLPVGTSYVVAARWEGAERKARLAAHFMKDFKEAFPIGPVEELDGQLIDRTDPALFSYDKRIHFVPSANVVLTLPATNDRVVIRKFDVDAALAKSAGGYLFVSSTPVRQASPGATYAHPVEVKAKNKEVAFELDSGPKGMTVSKAGLLTWDVPPGATDGAVIVSVTDGKGQKLCHSFTVRVR